MTVMVPPTIHSSVRSGAERRLFRIIEETPGTDAWFCLHSLALAKHGSKRRAEIDFLLITPDGLFVLEVKGGRIARERGCWIFTDRWGQEHRKTEGPFEQAAGCMFALERHLKEVFPERLRLRRVLLGHGVMFPDVAFEEVGTEEDPRQVYDRRTAERGFARYVRDLVEYTRSVQAGERNGLSKLEIAELVAHLRGDFDLVPTFATRSADVSDGLNRLTKSQYEGLALGHSRPRLVFEGAAGTGKSLLALELARREARSGRRVLLLCFNSLLAAKLGACMAEPALADRIAVHHFHGFARDLIARAALKSEFDDAARQAQQEDEVFRSLMPYFAELAFEKLGEPRFDVLVIDEAQDLLNQDSLSLLNAVLDGGLDGGRWRMFLDTNDQAAVYGKVDPQAHARLEQLSATHLLTVNCRNTREIEFATRAIAQPRAAASAWQDGDSVERRWYRDASDLPKVVDRVLRDIEHENIEPSSVTVLLAQRPGPELSRVLDRNGVHELRAGDFALAERRDYAKTHWSTVSAFKGLENDVVVMVGLAKVEGDWWRAITYVGMSRARIRLYLVISEEMRSLVEARFTDLLRLSLEEATLK